MRIVFLFRYLIRCSLAVSDKDTNCDLVCLFVCLLFSVWWFQLILFIYFSLKNKTKQKKKEFSHPKFDMFNLFCCSFIWAVLKPDLVRFLSNFLGGYLMIIIRHVCWFLHLTCSKICGRETKSANEYSWMKIIWKLKSN